MPADKDKLQVPSLEGSAKEAAALHAKMLVALTGVDYSEAEKVVAVILASNKKIQCCPPSLMLKAALAALHAIHEVEEAG